MESRFKLKDMIKSLHVKKAKKEEEHNTVFNYYVRVSAAFIEISRILENINLLSWVDNNSNNKKSQEVFLFQIL